MNNRVIHHSILALLLFCRTNNAHAETAMAVASKNLFNYSGNLYAQNFKVDEPQQTTAQEGTNGKQKPKLKAFSVAHATPHAQTSTLISLFGNTIQTVPCPAAIDELFVRKMELVSGERPDAHFVHRIDNTKTNAGKLALIELLVNPSYDISLLQQRQNAIRQLHESPALIAELQALLQKQAALEPIVLSYWQENDAATEELFNNFLYFSNKLKYLNKTPMALEASNQLGHVGLAYVAATLPISLSIAAAYIEYVKADALKQPISIREAFTRGIANATLKRTIYTDEYINVIEEEIRNGRDFALLKPETIGDLLACGTLGQSQASKKNAYKAFAGVAAGYGALAGGSYVYSLYMGITNFNLKRTSVNALQERLIAVAEYVANARAIATLVADNNLDAITQSIDQLSPFKQSASFNHLLKMLNSRTFRGKPSFFSLTGKILACHTLMQEAKNDFAALFKTVGLVDAYVSIAALLSRQSDNAHYCFVEYVENATPMLKAEGFWNPFIDQDTVVKNSISIGCENQPNNCVITGPNTGGKSTILKGILLNVLLPQTVGIGAADSIALTPFAAINCYLNITDDIASGVSLFKAEVLRAKALLEKIEQLPDNTHSFTIMDEVFSGTSPKEGEEAAYLYALKLGKFANSCTILATHFHKLTALEDTAPFANRRVTVIKQEDGSFVRPFTLEPGISTLNIAQDLLIAEGVL
ncbi:MAG: hypothetical protein WCE21_04735 [Candidatus Babeliales bacterium]